MWKNVRRSRRLETERRAKAEERAQQLAEHTRLKAQLEVLEQAEQSLAGYAEGARFLLDAARQARLKGARGALSTSLDVPAELEVAVAAALGDTLDAILLDANEIDEALHLLELDDAGRAALLPLDNHSRPPIDNPNDENSLGVASELVNAPEELQIGCPFAARSNADRPGSRDRAAFVGRFADPRAHRHAARRSLPR